jgi:DNA (cytosine-5)-methyltransferase 1
LIETELGPRDLLARIDELLEARYRSDDLGNVDDPLGETVYIFLSHQTREAVYRPLFAELRRRYPRWLDLLGAADSHVVALLRPGGFARQRAEKLKKLLSAVRACNEDLGVGPAADPSSDLTLDFVHGMTDAEAERFLTSLPGVGPKTARCVLSYSLERAAFAVDTHVHRVFTRLRLVESNGRKRDHDPFQDAVPESMRKRLHVNLVHHGRSICTSQHPRCGECVLVSFCRRGREAVAEADGSPAAVDLFAGAGGMGRGFRNAGFRIALAIESDRHAAQTYRLNNPGVPVIEARIDETTTGTRLRRYVPGVGMFHTVVAGAPCQGYSAAGARNPGDPQNRLYVHVARIARQLKAANGTLCASCAPACDSTAPFGFARRVSRQLHHFADQTDAAMSSSTRKRPLLRPVAARQMPAAVPRIPRARTDIPAPAE